MSTPGVKQDPEPGSSTTTTAAPSTTPTVSVAANMSAGIPVQTYSSPAHAQWAAAASQMVIDPQLQQQSATTPKPAVTPQPTTPAVTQAYYQAYSHYPQHYAYQYITQTQAAQHQQQQQQQHAATTHTPTTISSRATFSVATTPAPPTPVTAAHTPAIASTATTPAPTTYTTATTAYSSAAATTTTTAASTANNNNSLDTSDVATLNDALGSAGVDLRAEEESLQRHDFNLPSHLTTTSSIYLQNRQYEDRSRKQAPKPAFNTQNLGATMRTIGTEYKVTRIPEDTVNYMALALRARMQDLIMAMIEASKYRKEAQFDRPASMYDDGTGNQLPMWSIVVRSDVAKQLAVLERVEREEEMRIRRERKERQELAAQHTANLAAQANGTAMLGGEAAGSGGMMNTGGGEEDGQPKKKKKKDGPGVTARNLSEDVRKKMSNAVATQAAGLGKYSWMTASATSSPAPKKAATSTPAPSGSTAGGSSWARPYVPKKAQGEKEKEKAAATTTNVDEDPSKITVTMRDAVFVLEKERGHGAGRGAARGWR